MYKEEDNPDWIDMMIGAVISGVVLLCWIFLMAFLVYELILYLLS